MAIGIVTASNTVSKTLNVKNSFGKKRTKPELHSNVCTSPEKKSKTTSILTGAAVAAALGIGFGIYANKTGMFKTGIKTINTAANAIKEKISKVKANSMDELDRIIKDNTGIDGIHLDVIDRSAGMRSADLSQPERFHQAATWIEEAYKRAYSKAKLSDNNNMLNYIHNRVRTENNSLAQMYVQMPTAEANYRIKQFADDVASMDIHKGMTPQQFVKDMQEIFMPKAKIDLAL